MLSSQVTFSEPGYDTDHSEFFDARVVPKPLSDSGRGNNLARSRSPSETNRPIKEVAPPQSPKSVEDQLSQINQMLGRLLKERSVESRPRSPSLSRNTDNIICFIVIRGDM